MGPMINYGNFQGGGMNAGGFGGWRNWMGNWGGNRNNNGTNGHHHNHYHGPQGHGRGHGHGKPGRNHGRHHGHHHHNHQRPGGFGNGNNYGGNNFGGYPVSFGNNPCDSFQAQPLQNFTNNNCECKPSYCDNNGGGQQPSFQVISFGSLPQQGGWGGGQGNHNHGQKRNFHRYC